MQLFVEMCSTEQEQMYIQNILVRDLYKYAVHPKANYVLIATINYFHDSFVDYIGEKLILRIRDLALDQYGYGVLGKLIEKLKNNKLREQFIEALCKNLIEIS